MVVAIALDEVLEQLCSNELLYMEHCAWNLCFGAFGTPRRHDEVNRTSATQRVIPPQLGSQQSSQTILNFGGFLTWLCSNFSL
jgi:hypothetical protein